MNIYLYSENHDDQKRRHSLITILYKVCVSLSHTTETRPPVVSLYRAYRRSIKWLWENPILYSYLPSSILPLPLPILIPAYPCFACLALYVCLVCLPYMFALFFSTLPLSFLALSCPTLPYLALPYLALPSLPCLPCLGLPCLALSAIFPHLLIKLPPNCR